LKDDFEIWFWLSAFAAGPLLLFLMPVCVTGRKSRPALRRAWLAAVCGLAAVAAVELLSPTDIAWERALPAIACVAAAYLVFELAAAGTRCRRAAVLAVAGVAALGILSTVQASRRFLREVQPVDSPLPDDSAERLFAYESFMEAEGYAAATDAGTTIPLFVPKPDVRPEALDESPLDSLKGRIIRVAAPDVGTNCHGWTFTEGRAVVRGRDVPLILRENGYEPVSGPQPGDLVVYYDTEHKVTHTGVVRAVGADYVLVESKFGPLGRYLHAPPDQCFGSEFQYYRSPRAGHGLRMVGG
jgi:hypothetical protein